ncbi:serine/threonine-protein kinase [Streptomyces rubrolavendulae]|uniref:Serine/threonine-protein kinase AfsK n=1 Tax=Streptomyces rubrolavendulae TaxID=285473 RepID=A0A1D8G4M2_9ACTN|nr:serine/threonine-protein kinase [Streptomyces rubrolavendulae]AOT60374.1 Serine/threonine-protein kinase AfsK [Streptomyces rubrolavendulae]
MHPLEAGEPRAIGPYRLLGRLGAGGMGRVYLARSEGGRTVAVKVVHPHLALDGEFRARFRREVESARRVGGRWTAPVLDADPDATVPWIATGYVAGPSLTQAVTAHGPLPERSVRVLGAGLAEALATVHASGLVHRDVKPSNVLLALDGPRLIDFGIARAVDATTSLTSTGVSVGSPGFMSPEQIIGKAGGGGPTGATDVFSLGAVLAYAATGSAPFSGDSSAALLYKVVHEEPELGPALAGPLRDLVAACLAKDPAARPAPGDLAAGLAPEPSATATGGWLPAAVVEEVSRAAVRLLDLDVQPVKAGAERPGEEAAEGPAQALGAGPVEHGRHGREAGTGAAGLEGAGAGPGVLSGPVPFSSPAVVPPMPPVPPAVGGAAVRDGVPARGGDPVRGAEDLSTVDAVPPPRRPPVSVSLTAGAEPTGPRGGRRLSCTLALAVAGALAAVTVGGAILFDVLPRGGGGGEDPAAKPPGADGGAAAPSGPQVPQAFLGTWKGPFAAPVGAAGETPAVRLTVAVRSGGAGQAVGRVVRYDEIGRELCQDTLVLRGVTGDTLTTDTSAHHVATDVCTRGTRTVTLRLEAGRLHYASDDAAAGRPRATLDRAE